MDKRIASVLERLAKVQQEQGTFWNVSPETGNFLNILARSLQARCILEIGTSNGYSGLWFAEALSHTGGKLYTVESHQQRFAMAKQHFAEAGVQDIVQQCPGHAPEIFLDSTYQWSLLKFDMIFLDATKMEYQSYFQAVSPLLRDGGLLVADNIFSHEKELTGFVESLQKKREFRTELLPLGTGLLVALKTGES